MIGTNNVRWSPLPFYTAFADNDGALGWNYCGVFKEDIFQGPQEDAAKDLLRKIPAEHDDMEGFWLPRPHENGLCTNPFGHEEMYAVTRLVRQGTDDGQSEAEMTIQAGASIEVYLDGQLAVQGKNQVILQLPIQKAAYDVAVRLYDMQEKLQFEYYAKNVAFCLPDCVKGLKGDWLYLDTKDPKAQKGFRQYELYDSYEAGKKEYFKCGKDTYIRPVLEQNLYGKSNYPIGVVLYGLLMAADYLQDEEILSYAHNHLKSCYASCEYMVWDKDKFGCPCINHQLALVDTLDDCGSFASSSLEDYLKYHKNENIMPFADYVGDYILYKQERLENGMFFRRRPGTLHKNTIWADDLYMSVPFLVRYAVLKNDRTIMDDAVNQFLCFKEKLFMEEKGLMSHVYNLTFDKATGVPWGRGNGWVLFSLSEILAYLPKGHEHYAEIAAFFKQLAGGFLQNIDEEGMVHQVVWRHDSYAETSCTAMCASAFARGVRMGILPREPYFEASKKCVEALKRYCIDEDGNIYGVCRGSGYSFREEYYMNELPWVKNDTHGTGIVLIAMIETAKEETAQVSLAEAGRGVSC